jgi:hypothetical protein
MQRRASTFGLLALIIVAAIIQFIQPQRTNPPVDPHKTFEAIAKPSPAAAAIIHRSCYDCHSNFTRWPWYSHIAPISWLIADDVKKGRNHVNFSEWGQLKPEVAQSKLEDICNEVRTGEMPLETYVLMHKNTRLSPSDKEILCKPIATGK